MNKEYTPEEIKNRLSNIGEAVGNIALGYIEELERKLEQAEKELADYQFNYPTIKEVQKENAELKEKLNIRSCQNCRRNNRTCPNDGSCKYYSKWEGYKNPQLIKAIEIIKKLNDRVCGRRGDDLCLLEQVEQFLKEESDK